MMRPTNWVSPGPQTRWGRMATIGMAADVAASASISAMALLVA